MGRAGRALILALVLVTAAGLSTCGGEDESGAELAALDPKTLLAESGYAPG